jgi:hypothetical protein
MQYLNLWMIISEEINNNKLGDTKEELNAILVIDSMTTARRKYGNQVNPNNCRDD